jgi:hypothetical protein
MLKTLKILIFSLLPAYGNAQIKYDYNWVTGYGTFDINFGGTKINFNSGTPVLDHFALPYHFGFNMPCSISDMDGNLQFYSNGCKIVNFNNEVIENGDDLSPGPYQSIECDNAIYGYDSYQNMMILPRPGHLNRYVYFHHTIESNISQGKILYSEVDMNFNSGKGKVILKNQVLRGPVLKEWAMTAVKHGNGQDWWIIIPQEKVNIYNLYLLTPDSIKGPFVQNWENAEAAQYEKFGLNVVISPDGKKFARMTNSEVSVPKIYLYDFDRCSGSFSNVQTISMPDTIEYSPWIAISPNSRFLYLQSGQIKLYQYDLWSSDISASAQLIGVYDGFVHPLGFSGAFNAMALAPNNKIYMCCTSGINYYHTIHAPDKLGLACDFRQHDLELPTVNNNLMPLYPNYRLGPIDSSSCDTLGADNLCVAFFRWAPIDTLSPLQVEFTDLSYFEPAVWFWNFGDGGAISQEINPVHTYAAPGTYQVCLTVCNANACDSECMEVEVKTVGTISVHGEDGEISLSPNPASDIMHVQFEAGFHGRIVISDLAGSSVQTHFISEESRSIEVPVNQLENGAYVLTFFDASGKLPSSVKFMVLR